jgi:hypothetical protein
VPTPQEARRSCFTRFPPHSIGYDNDDDDDGSSSYDYYKVLLLQQLAAVATRMPSLQWIFFGGRLNTISNNWPE